MRSNFSNDGIAHGNLPAASSGAVEGVAGPRATDCALPIAERAAKMTMKQGIGKSMRNTVPGLRKGAKVTMTEIGKLAGVSQGTVSRALSSPAKVAPETMQRIREAIRITGFVPNANAGALASSRSRLVSALVPSLTNPVYASMMQSFSDLMRQAGYQILLSESGFGPEEEEKLVAAHLSRRPDAFYLTGIHHSPGTRQMLIAAEIPVVEVWDLTDSPIDICVGFEHRDVGRAVADFALEAGYGSAASISAGDERALRRLAAFDERFAARGGQLGGAIRFGGPASVANGRMALARLIDEMNFTSGLIACSSDVMAQGVLIEAQKRGLPVPDQIAVIGFGDQDFAAHLEPALTTVRVDRPALGTNAAEAILSQLNNEALAKSRIDIGFEIVRRASA